MNTAIELYASNLADNDSLITRWYDYNQGYICDIIAEIADSAISIYTQDQIDYAMENMDSVDEAIGEGLVSFDPDIRNGSDFRNMIAQAGVGAWYRDNTQRQYVFINECINYAIAIELERLGWTEFNDDQLDYLDNMTYDQDEKLENVIEIAIDELSVL